MKSALCVLVNYILTYKISKSNNRTLWRWDTPAHNVASVTNQSVHRETFTNNPYCWTQSFSFFLATSKWLCDLIWPMIYEDENVSRNACLKNLSQGGTKTNTSSFICCKLQREAWDQRVCHHAPLNSCIRLAERGADSGIRVLATQNELTNCTETWN